VTDTSGFDFQTAGDVAARAAEAYRTLADLAETVEDEWQYVTDLVEAYEPALRNLAGPHPARPVAAEAADAVAEAIAEIALITDPHKAIDWLSTFPHVVALALGGDVDDDSDLPAGADNDSIADDDNDNPFRMLLRGDR
jgi:hypothetical protein